ncbi:glycoside hydrolase [Parabacteroides sp. OttesenSCG-928-G07]|nr:glycoside hydrolase [Parabacteroides sp. OttesenSCG-928-G21]MDL2277983.1 glycoside hydrolase [Parabacteroides sp. OttesenSCG-928-G07]
MKRFLSIVIIAFTLFPFLSQEVKAEGHPVFGKAWWINTERCQSATNTWLIYRKKVDMEKVPTSLVAHIAADTKYWLWINDEMVVFEGGLKRGPTPNDSYYDSVDIAPWLREGENTIAVLVWYFGKDGFSHISSGKAGLLFAAFADGIEVISDNTWQCSVYDAYQNTEAPFPNYRLPESNIRFDARKAIEGWHTTGFEQRLSPAMSFAPAGFMPMGRLIARPIPQWKNSGLVDYSEVRRSGDTLFCKLPYNCHITPYLEVEAPAGKQIAIKTDNYDGGSELNVRAEYITREGKQEYESYGWMNGHVVEYIIPEGVEVLAVKYRETGYDTEFSGSFSCNDPFYTELWKRSARTLYVTMRDNYMDCPDRERAQWWGDEVNELGETFYALSPSSHQLAVKGIYELMNWQRRDGTIASPVPAGNWDKELPLQMLASVGWYGFYTQYYYSGDSSFVADIYNRLRYYLHGVWKLDKSGLVIERSGGWNWGDWGDNVDIGVLTNCWYYLALKAEKAFALQLGKTADAESINRQMRTLANCFDSKFWTGSAYRSPGYKGETDDRSQAMAVLSGLASEDKYPAILKVLKKEWHASPYMEKYVLEALFVMGEANYALERMKQRYRKMMAYSYTTLFEGWGIGSEGFGGGTINHAWSGGPLTLLSQKVCGIQPTSPGFKTFSVIPQLGTLTEVQATVTTHYGNIEVHIQKQKSKIQVKITVPTGTEAIVQFPDGKQKRLTAGVHTVNS